MLEPPALNSMAFMRGKEGKEGTAAAAAHYYSYLPNKRVLSTEKMNCFILALKLKCKSKLNPEILNFRTRKNKPGDFGTCAQKKCN